MKDHSGVYAIALSLNNECRIYIRKSIDEVKQLGASLYGDWHIIFVDHLQDRTRVNGCLESLELKLTNAFKTGYFSNRRIALSEVREYFKSLFKKEAGNGNEG